MNEKLEGDFLGGLIVLSLVVFIFVFFFLSYTAAQFTFNRDRGVDLSSYMGAEEIPEENADDISMEATTSPKQDAASKADQGTP